MATIVPFIRKDWRGVFGPETIDIMSDVFDDLCEQLAIPPTAKAAREVVARRVIGLARKGERDPERLRKAALKIIGVPARVTGL